MTGNHDIIRQNDVITAMHIVRNMRIGEERAVVSNDRLAATTFCARIHRHAFADHAIRTDGERIFFAVEFQILRLMTDGSKRKNARARADTCFAAKSDMRDQLDTITQSDIGTHMAEGANRHPFPDLRTGFHHGTGMNPEWRNARWTFL